MNTTEVDTLSAKNDLPTTFLTIPSSRIRHPLARQSVSLPVMPRSPSAPPCLFEPIYASTMICHFGAIPMDLFKKWEVVFYEPDGTSKAGRTDDNRRDVQADAEKETE